ncbi:BSD domain [Arabidopsis suecica]|uniref:BSD domain n=1 Tax=Arabidopsis suecica TaxID=45249 RepID=A0A8T2BCF4_ARASU|nr:BSD domain [Arabidopsis suecica]
MSWLFKSRGDDDHDHDPSSPTTHGGVKEDLSSLLRGVAAFLAPPPSPPSAPPVDERRLSSDSPTQLGLTGIRNDLAEIRGNFSNFASNLLQFPSNLRDRETSRRSVLKDEGLDQAPGISDEVVDFAIKISTRPGCWTDFPLSLNTEFELSEAQRAHASAIEHLVPGLVAVKNQVSSYMDDEHFWLIYFILLMPRLNGHDFELLATCKVFETRDKLLLKLQKKETGSSKSSGGHETPEEGSSRASETVEGVIDKIETLKIEQREISDESSEEQRRSFRDEEVISFSDLDVDDLSERPCSNRSTLKRPASNASGSSWVQLSKSQVGHSKDSEGDSSDWLPIGDSD